MKGKLIFSEERTVKAKKSGDPYTFFNAILAVEGIIVKASTEAERLPLLKDKIGAKFALYRTYRATEDGVLVEGWHLGEEKLKKSK